jgi:hypothetical protein
MEIKTAQWAVFMSKYSAKLLLKPRVYQISGEHRRHYYQPGRVFHKNLRPIGANGYTNSQQGEL